MQLEGYHSGLKDKKPSDSFVLVVQLITPLYGASRQFVFVSASHFGKRCLFPSLPSLTLPYPQELACRLAYKQLTCFCCRCCQYPGCQQIGFLLGSCGVSWALTSDACLKSLPKDETGHVCTFKGEVLLISFYVRLICRGHIITMIVKHGRTHLWRLSYLVLVHYATKISNLWYFDFKVC